MKRHPHHPYASSLAYGSVRIIVDPRCAPGLAYFSSVQPHTVTLHPSTVAAFRTVHPPDWDYFVREAVKSLGLPPSKKEPKELTRRDRARLALEEARAPARRREWR